jgi:geranyl-CoA carboxylase beta subunit
MGDAQAAQVMELITLEKLRRAGQAGDVAPVEAMAKAMAAQLDKESSVLFGTARLWDDGIIDPRDTRVLRVIFSVAATRPVGHGRGEWS